MDARMGGASQAESCLVLIAPDAREHTRCSRLLPGDSSISAAQLIAELLTCSRSVERCRCAVPQASMSRRGPTYTCLLLSQVQDIYISGSNAASTCCYACSWWYC